MIKVQGLNYQVLLRNAALTSDLDGESLLSDCMITIRANMPVQRQQQTLWHEVMHVIMEGEDGGGLSPKEEKFVTRISNTLFAVLSDNRLLAPGWWNNVVDHAEFDKYDDRG